MSDPARPATAFNPSRLAAAIAVLGVGLFGTSWALVHWFDTHRALADRAPETWVIRLAPVLIALIGLALAFVMTRTRGMDELDRRIHSEALAFGFLATFFTGMMMMGLSGVGIGSGRELQRLVPSMVIFWSLGILISRRRYR